MAKVGPSLGQMPTKGLYTPPTVTHAPTTNKDQGIKASSKKRRRY